MNLSETFWNKVDKKDPEECWKWTGNKNKKGYGRFYLNKKYYSAHRVAYLLTSNIEIPTNMCVCHKCDNPECVNPNHLFLGTIKDNNRDRDNKNRNGLRKLTLENVMEIIKDDGKERGAQTRLAKKFNVSCKTINHILRGYRWSYFTGIEISKNNL